MEHQKNEPILKLMKIREGAVIPERQTEGSAGFDLCACILEDLCIQPGDLVTLPTGLGVEIPEGCAGMIFTRSGLGVKHGIHVSNGVGVIDSDYRGEMIIGLTNSSRVPYVVSPGDRIAQLIVMPVVLPTVQLVEELTVTDRGSDGFGSTGK